MLARAAGSSRYLLGHDRKVATQFVDGNCRSVASPRAMPYQILILSRSVRSMVSPSDSPLWGGPAASDGFVVPGDLGAGAPVVDGEGGWVEVCVVAGVRQKWWPMVALALQHPAGRPCLARWLCLA
jgi:hypothetical protein